MIYFDHSATSYPKPACVIAAVNDALTNMTNSARGGYGLSLNASRCLYTTRQAVARLLGSQDCSQIVFTLNATESLNMAIKGLIHPGDHVITTMAEHNSVLRPLYQLEKQGVALSFLPLDEKGRVNLNLETYLRSNTKAIVISHASNVTGNCVDLTLVSQFAKKHQLLLIVDAAQSIGHIDVKVDDIDVLCFSGHKGLLSPFGVGVLYVKKELHLPPLKVGGSGIHSFDHDHPSFLPDALEAGTMNVHSIAGLKSGIEYIEATGLDVMQKHALDLAEAFYAGIKDLPGLQFYGDYQTRNRVPIVSFTVKDWDSSSVCDWLYEHDEICVRGGAHCAPLVHEWFHTETQGMIRFSFGWSNTLAEVQTAIQAIKELLS